MICERDYCVQAQRRFCRLLRFNPEIREPLLQPHNRWIGLSKCENSPNNSSTFLSFKMHRGLSNRKCNNAIDCFVAEMVGQAWAGNQNGCQSDNTVSISNNNDLKLFRSMNCGSLWICGSVLHGWQIRERRLFIMSSRKSFSFVSKTISNGVHFSLIECTKILGCDFSCSRSWTNSSLFSKTTLRLTSLASHVSALYSLLSK